jgi:hypothetical protein
MRELDALEFQAVAGGRLAPAPAPRHPIAALVVAILRAILRPVRAPGGNPPPQRA